MTRVAIFRESVDPGSTPYPAVAGQSQAMGRTAGEALDALTSLLPPEDASTLVVVRNMGPDQFFTAEQCRRLEELTARHRRALSGQASWSEQDAAELENLVDAELHAATERSKAIGTTWGDE